jgi:peroxiredoxin
MKKNGIVVTIVAFCAVVAGIIFFGGSSRAPDSTFVLMDGSKKQTVDLRGQVALVNFWATSCVSCVAEMPDMVRTYEKYKGKGFGTVAVAMQYDPPSYVVNFVTSRKLPFDIALDNTGAVAKAWGDVQITPTTYLLNKRGEIVKRFVGSPDFTELHALIDKLLLES